MLAHVYDWITALSPAFRSTNVIGVQRHVSFGRCLAAACFG